MMDKIIEKSIQRKADRQNKLLQYANLSPSESWMEKLENVHPMKQIFWASVVQVSVFGFMLLAFWLINIGLNT
tara:strand:+ start:626 stop:844 length:219 start_codon:yes stop_codon:yes gene_type:complete